MIGAKGRLYGSFGQKIPQSKIAGQLLTDNTLRTSFESADRFDIGR